MHPVFDLHQPSDVLLARAYFNELARLAPRHRFGFVGTRQGISVQVMAAERAAAYLSSYFVSGAVRNRSSTRTRETRTSRVYSSGLAQG